MTLNTDSLIGSRVLVTGGTGSFGKTVTKRLLARGVGEVRILSRDEAKQDQMRHELSNPRARFYLGDVREPESVGPAMRGVDHVFHAAALKQVPSCEFFPLEAVRTNVLGSQNVVAEAVAANVKSVVCLSTDKAVYPVNAMGISKAMMEKVALSYGLNNPDASTTVSCVRYGNVMYSRGSVIPLFIEQIRRGQQLTITNPEMTRFMMSLDESVDLVEHAFVHANQGDLFVKKAASCTIGALAAALANLFGLEGEPFRVIGTRHAEKLSEALASREELSRAEDMGGYYRIPADIRDLNYAAYMEEGDPSQTDRVAYDSHTAERLDVAGVEELLLSLPQVRDQLEEAGRVVSRIAARAAPVPATAASLP